MPVEWLDSGSWRLPSGKALAEFALQAGFLAPLLFRVETFRKESGQRAPSASMARPKFGARILAKGAASDGAGNHGGRGGSGGDASTIYGGGRISNWIPGSAFAGGVILQTVQHGWRGTGSALAGTAAGAGVFLVFYLLGGMGGGDVKLMAGFGALLGCGSCFCRPHCGRPVAAA